MTDLRDRLQAALGSAYRIEQELGGGGMSRVFLAEETALGLGELYEARGDRVNAATYYNKVLDLWKNTDVELQPAVADVKQRLARLTAEH